MAAQNGLEDVLTLNAGSALWGVRRAQRLQEQYAVHQLKEALAQRGERLAAERLRLTLARETLRGLEPALAEEHYVASEGDLAALARLRDLGAMGELGELALRLAKDLVAPPEDPAVEARLNKIRADLEEQQRDYRKHLEMLRAFSATVPGFQERFDQQRKAKGEPTLEETLKRENLYPEPEPGEGEGEPSLSAEEWAGREPLRRVLQQTVAEGLARCERRLKANALESAAPPTPDELAALLAPNSGMRLMRRLEDSSHRYFWRAANLLLKLRKLAAKGLSPDFLAGGEDGTDAKAPPEDSPGFEPATNPAGEKPAPAGKAPAPPGSRELGIPPSGRLAHSETVRLA